MILTTIEFLARTQVDRGTLEVWIKEEWLIPSAGAPDFGFSEADLARAQLIQDLTGDLGVNAEGVGIILHLVDQVHGLRAVLSDVVKTARDAKT